MPFRYFNELTLMPFLKGVLALALTFLAKMVGHPGSAAKWLFALMVMDFVLGFSRAWRLKTIQAVKLRSGAFKFFWYWVAISIFVMADAAIQPAIPVATVFRDSFIAYLAVNEALSCIDHLAYFHVPVPKSFLTRLRRFRHELDRRNNSKDQHGREEE